MDDWQGPLRALYAEWKRNPKAFNEDPGPKSTSRLLDLLENRTKSRTAASILNMCTFVFALRGLLRVTSDLPVQATPLMQDCRGTPLWDQKLSYPSSLSK
jgi:hypothetical protein